MHPTAHLVRTAVLRDTISQSFLRALHLLAFDGTGRPHTHNCLTSTQRSVQSDQDWRMNPALSSTPQENCWFNCDVVTCYFGFAIYLSPPHGISRYSATRWRQNTTYGHRIQDFDLTGRYRGRTVTNFGLRVCIRITCTVCTGFIWLRTRSSGRFL